MHLTGRRAYPKFSLRIMFLTIRYEHCRNLAMISSIAWGSWMQLSWGLSNHPPTPIGRQKASKWHEPNVFVFCTHAIRVLDICLGVFVVYVQRVHLVRRRQLVSPPRLFCNLPQTRASPCQWRSASVRDRSQNIQSAAALQYYVPVLVGCRRSESLPLSNFRPAL